MKRLGICLWLLAALGTRAVDSIVVFNEIHYHPTTNEAANEFVELHNQMAIDIDLSAWSITGSIGYTFAEGTIVPAGGYLVVAADPAALRANTGITNVAGPFSGRLNNLSATLRLRDRNDRLMDEVEFRDSGKWPLAPDGSGVTLAKRDEDATSDSPEHWTSSVRAGGTPGGRNFPTAAPLQRRSLVSFNSLWRFEASGTDLGTSWRETAFDDSAWAGRNNATLVSYWPFDGNATATRGTSGNLLGGPGAAADRNGAAGGALAFDGVSQYVSVAGGGGLNAATAGTVSLWVKWTGNQDGDCCGTFGAVLARQGNGLFSDDILALNSANPATARIVWRQSGGPAPVLITGTTAVGTNWHHIAVTFAPGNSTLYVDGVAEGSAAGAALNNNANVPLSIGAWASDGAGFSHASIDDVAVWDRALTPAQVAGLATQSKTPLDFGAPENAAYFAGNGRLATSDELRRTEVPLGATTYYFRNTFEFTDEPGQTELKLDAAVDDGAIFFLNGVEVYRHNMPAGAVDYSTFASSSVGDAPLVTGITLPSTNLVRGANTLAVEVHQAGAGDAGMVFGAGLNAIVSPAPPAEERLLISRNDTWKFDASNSDPGSAWRTPLYNDVGWSNGAALFFAGSGEVDGVGPERITAVTASASSEYTADGRLAVNAVNGAGLLGNAHVNTAAGTMWLTRGTFAAPNDLNPQITFDLGAVVPLRWLKVWNYNEDVPGRPELLSRGTASGDILVAVTNGLFSTFTTNQLFTKAPGTQTDFSQLIDLGGIAARYVRLDKLTNFPGGDFRFVGLSEVQFFRDPDLKRTELPPGPLTYYFRKTFNFGGDPAHATLFLNAAVDDGAVFYLNGVEIHRINMTADVVTHSTLASSATAHATFSGALSVPASSLVRGANVLAVEVHQASASGDPDMIFGAQLTAQITPAAPEEFVSGALVFNEISAASSNAFQVELVNAGPQTFDTSGYLIQRAGLSPDAEYLLPAQTLAPGQLLLLGQATLGFGAVAGDKLFLHLPARRGVADSIEVHERARGRSPDGAGEWFTPAASTPGVSNAFAFHDEVVINEIMYHGSPTHATPPVLGTNTLITLTNLWRYEQSGTDLGTAWRAPEYADAAWASGAGLFYVTMNNLPAAKNTPLDLGPTTYYFRTSFIYTGTPEILSLSLRHVVDDGAVFYLNGVEVNRFNMAAGTVRYTNNTLATILNATLRAPVAVALSNLVIGTNILAVEVHQSANSGNDVVFGAELTATVEAVARVPFSDSPEQWLELFNRTSNAVNLTGWRLDEGVDYRFPSNTTLPAGGYLVLAKDPAELLSRFPGIAVLGPYTNSLSHRGERVVLKDANDNPADAVHYFDDGRWPEAADAGGASLELRDPRADNSAGEAWAASDESGRSSWRTYTYRGVAAPSAVGPDGQWHEFVMGLLEAGEVLLDDVSVIETPNTTPVQLIQNGTFDNGTNTWRIIGNHHGEVIDDPDQPGNKVLRLVATGSTEHMSNHGETTFVGNRDVVNGREYLLSFRAKWISGSRQFNTRLYFNRLARTTILDAPALHGTPGARNSTFASNLGPTYSGLRHEPVVPAPFAPVTVSVAAADPDEVASMTLWSRVDGGTWTSVPMMLASNSVYAGVVPGKPAATIVQFYVEGTDARGATSTYPAAGTNSRALYQVDDGLAAKNGLHNVRLIALTADSDVLLRTVNLMSNERIGCTMIYDEREIYYDVGLRLKGSEHSRTTTPRLGFNIGFTSEQLFRGVHHTVAIDRSESTGFGQREMLVHQMLNHAGRVPTKYHDLVQVIAPRPEYTGSAELQLARYSDVFLDDQFPDGSHGTVFEYELVYQLNSTDTGTPEGNKIPAPDSVTGTTIRNLGDDKEGYRWDFLIKNNEERDDFSGIMAFAKVMELTGTAFTSQITNVIDVDQWLRGVAVNVLSGVGDSYGGDGAQHNVQFYVRPGDSRVLYLPHDMDAFYNATRPIVPNADVTKLIAVPAYARAFYSHLLDVIATTYNGSYMARWADQFGRLLPAQNFAGHLAFIVERANYVTAQVNAAVPAITFAITSNTGNNFGTTNDLITLTGSAPLSVQEIQVNGVSYPITWASTTSWTLRVPLLNGPNQLSVQGLDRTGLPLTNAVDTITVTNSGVGAPFPVVINEWMADNAAPGGLADPADGLFQDWFELYNPNTNAVNLAGYFLTDNLLQPTKWQIPLGTVVGAGDFLLVWADNQPEQNATSTNGHLHAGFQLNNSGEAIGLFSPGGVAQHVVVFGAQIQNVSEGLFPDGNTNGVYSMTNWTPRAANTLSGPLRIARLALDAGIVTITWAATPGHNYRVEFKDDLDAPTWAPLGEIMANDVVASATDAAPAATHRFYRIVRVD